MIMFFLAVITYLEYWDEVTGSSSFVRLDTQDMFYCLDIAYGNDGSRMKFSFLLHGKGNLYFTVRNRFFEIKTVSETPEARYL